MAASITILQDTVGNDPTNRGLNDVGLIVGDRNEFGAFIAPVAGSTLSGQQSGFVVSAIPCGVPTTQSPNSCFAGTPYDSSRLGAWTVTFRNGSDSAIVATPPLIGTEVPVPLAANVSISGEGVTPTFRFVVPEAFTPDAIESAFTIGASERQAAPSM